MTHLSLRRFPRTAGAAFDDRQIAAMDGAHALRFWRQHKTKLLALGQREDVSA